MRAEVGIFPVELNIEQHADQSKQMVFISFLVLHHAGHMIMHGVIILGAHPQEVDGAVRAFIEGIGEILLDQSGDEGIMRFFATKAIHFTKATVEGNRGMIQIGFGEPADDTAEGRTRSGEHNINILFRRHDRVPFRRGILSSHLTVYSSNRKQTLV